MMDARRRLTDILKKMTLRVGHVWIQGRCHYRHHYPSPLFWRPFPGERGLAGFQLGFFINSSRTELWGSAA